MKVNDRDCGKHSGIPSCCVLWYIGVWKKAIMNIPKLWRMYYSVNDTDNVEYIRCPVCILLDYTIELKECGCHESR